MSRDENLNPYKSSSGEKGGRTIGVLDVVAVISGISVALLIAMFAIQRQRYGIGDQLFNFRIYLIGLFIFGASIGGFFRRWQSKTVGKGIVVGGFGFVFLRAVMRLLGIPIPF